MKKALKKLLVLFCGVAIGTVLHVNSVIATTIKIVNPISTNDFTGIIENTLLWVLGIAGSIALLTLIAGGIMYVTSAGDEQKVTAAKKVFNFTVIGLILVLFSYSIIVTFTDILT